MTGHSDVLPCVRRVSLFLVPFVVALALPAFAAALERKLIAPEGSAGDQFGASVAIDGDTAVVGAPNEDAAYVFTRSGDTWARTGKLTASDGADSALGHSVAIDGDTIVVAAPGAGGGGALYTFARTGPAARGETAKLTVSNAMASGLGASVAIDGETIVAGSSEPRIYTFARSGAAQRNETATLFASDLGTGDDGEVNGSIGRAVAIDGDTIVAGAPRDAPPGSPFGSVGAVYTFATTGDPQRTETAKLTASNAELSMLGLAVAIEGDTIVAAAPLALLNADGQGTAYTFARTGPATRSETGQLTASDGDQGDSLGSSIAIDGDRILAGAPNDNVGANTDQGSVYEFARTGAAVRTETATLRAADGASDDGLGASVAIDGDTIIAGAPSDDVGASADEGSASIFFPATPPPPPPPPPPGGVATCSGQAATIVPDGDQTVVTGTAGDDVIVGTGANETIDGRGGDDLICAGGGDDRVRGGRGADDLRGDSGDDEVLGDGGDDAVRGGMGDDLLRGGSGHDIVRGATGRDDVRGGSGDDRLSGGDSRDRVFGGPGDDDVLGGAGGDRISSGSGSDRVFGGWGADVIRAIDGTTDRVDCGRGRDLARLDTRDRRTHCERVLD